MRLMHLRRKKITWKRKADQYLDMTEATVWMLSIALEQGPSLDSRGGRGSPSSALVHIVIE